MNLPTTNSTHYFILKDGVIEWIKDMPSKADYETVGYTSESGGADPVEYVDADGQAAYDQALISAINNTLKVENYEITKVMLTVNGNNGNPLEIGKVYSLQCRVKTEERRRYKRESGIWTKWYAVEPSWVDGEEHESKTVALVTFDQASEPNLMDKLEAVNERLEAQDRSHRVQNTEQLLVNSDAKHPEPGDSEKGDGWIDVNERLPDKDGFYNVKLDGEFKEVFSLWYHEKEWRFDSTIWAAEAIFHAPFGIEVTHWQPLPEPPRKREVK